VHVAPFKMWVHIALFLVYSGIAQVTAGSRYRHAHAAQKIRICRNANCVCGVD
jgi:hypothetical protein